LLITSNDPSIETLNSPGMPKFNPYIVSAQDRSGRIMPEKDLVTGEKVKTRTDVSNNTDSRIHPRSSQSYTRYCGHDLIDIQSRPSYAYTSQKQVLIKTINRSAT
jgi:hypothetical protein